MPKLLIIFLLIFSGLEFHAQGWFYNKWFTNEIGQFVGSDASGNIYSIAEGELKKYDLQGKVLLTLHFPDALSLVAFAAQQDSFFYVGGIQRNKVSFDGDTLRLRGFSDGWLAKYNAQGKKIWIKQVSGIGDDWIADMAVYDNQLILTGSLSDSAAICGQSLSVSPKNSFYVAKISSDGMLNTVNFAHGSDTLNMQAVSWATEMEVDRFGNIVLLVNSKGSSSIDNYQFDTWRHYPYPWVTTSMIRLNKSLKCTFTRFLDSQGMIYRQYAKLRLNQHGEIWYNKDEYTNHDGPLSTVIRVDSVGKDTVQIRARLDKELCVTDMNFDNCDNLYLTGRWRGFYNGQKTPEAFWVAQLSPGLKINWFVQDSSEVEIRVGNCIKVIDHNDCIVTGIFTGTLQLVDTVDAGSSGLQFFARIHDPSSDRCILAISEMENHRILKVFPIPASDLINISGGQEGVYRLIDNLGRELQCGTLTPQIIIDFLPAGIYLLVVDVENRSYSFKVLKE
jgi:hypothetical protein